MIVLNGNRGWTTELWTSKLKPIHMKTKLFDQHSEHTEWTKDLAFYSDELKLMQTRLEEISSKNTASDVRVEVEHFQNQVFIQENNIQRLRHHIAGEEKALQSELRSNPTASDHRSAPDHQEEREMVKSFEANFKQLREEFNAFLAKRL